MAAALIAGGAAALCAFAFVYSLMLERYGRAMALLGLFIVNALVLGNQLERIL